jgi:hypothetical protein
MLMLLLISFGDFLTSQFHLIDICVVFAWLSNKTIRNHLISKESIGFQIVGWCASFDFWRFNISIRHTADAVRWTE